MIETFLVLHSDACPLESRPHQPAGAANDKRKAARNTKKNKLKSLGSDETITVMHALGRIFNPKCKPEYRESEAVIAFILTVFFIVYCRADQEIANSDGHRKFLHSPDDISSTFTTQPRNMLTLTHTNYLCHFNSIENTLGAADDLTRADTFLNEWRVS